MGNAIFKPAPIPIPKESELEKRRKQMAEQGDEIREEIEDKPFRLTSPKRRTILTKRPQEEFGLTNG